MFLIYLAPSVPSTGLAYRGPSVNTSRPRQWPLPASVSLSTRPCEFPESGDKPGLPASSVPSKETGTWRGSMDV